MNTKTCSSCQHYETQTRTVGTCHRYPKPASAAPDHWCGEYQLAETHDVEWNVKKIMAAHAAVYGTRPKPTPPDSFRDTSLPDYWKPAEPYGWREFTIVAFCCALTAVGLYLVWWSQ